MTAVTTSSVTNAVHTMAPSLPPQSNIMLLGQQPVLSNIVMNTAVSDDGASQIGRKIMPKPQIVAHLAPPMVNSVSLTPITLPPQPTDNGLLSASVDAPTADNVKKKRTRTHKGKQKKGAAAEAAGGDILAEAAASLFPSVTDQTADAQNK